MHAVSLHRPCCTIANLVPLAWWGGVGSFCEGEGWSKGGAGSGWWDLATAVPPGGWTVLDWAARVACAQEEALHIYH